MNLNQLQKELNRMYAYTLINYDRDWATFRDMKANKIIPKDAIFENQGDYVEIDRMMKEIIQITDLDISFPPVDKVSRKDFQNLVQLIPTMEQKFPFSLYQIEKRLESIIEKLNFEKYVEEKDAERE